MKPAFLGDIYMPTIADSRYPKPLGWNEFEDICLTSCKLRWGNPNLTRHGRPGQKQQGVDIYGYDDLQRLVGVQCKNTVGSISRTLIEKEIKNAESFVPALSSLFIATTADGDTPLQRYVREVSEARYRQGRFTVAILFWGDIVHDLSKDATSVAKHFPQFFGFQSAVDPAEIRRQRDIKLVTDLLSYIDIVATEPYLAYAPKYVAMNFLEHIDCFRPHIASPLFVLYDKELDRHLGSWLSKWMDIAALIQQAPYDYNERLDKLIFRMPGDFCQTKLDEEQYNRIDRAVGEFFALQSAFCDFIRQHYFEIDLEKTSATARQFHSGFRVVAG